MGKNQSASGLTNIIQYDNNGNVSFVSGSTTLMQISSSGAITTTGVISGSNALSSSFSLNSGLLNSTGSVGFATTGSLLTVSSSQQQISASQQQMSASLLTLTASFNAVSASQQQISASYIALSASYNTFSGSASTRITVDSASLLQVSASQQQISASLLNVISIFATTGSNSFRADQSITGSLVVSSTITAQTLVVQTVTSSILYSSGSNIFGNQLANTQTFTGSVNITGSLALAGNITGNAITLTGALSGSSATFSGIMQSPQVAIGGTAYPNVSLTFKGTINGNNDSWGAYQGALTHAPNLSNSLAVGYEAGGIVNTGTYTGLSYRGFYQENLQANTGTGTLATAYGVYIDSLTRATNNYSAYFAQNVGIGTATPSEKLTIEGAVIRLQGGVEVTPFAIANNNSDGFRIYDYTAAATRLTIASSGIATFACQVCSPNHIASSTCSTAGLRVYGASGTHQWDMYLNGANLRFSDNTSGGCFVVDTSSTFGGDLYIKKSDGFQNIIIQPTTTTAAAGTRFLNTGNDMYMFIDNSGGDYGPVGANGASYAYNANIRVVGNRALQIATNDTVRMSITSAGIACFACTVCAPSFRGGSFNGTNYTTITNQATIPSSCTSTILTLSSSAVGVYIVQGNFGGQGNTAYGSTLIVVANSGAFRIVTNGSASNSCLTLSGANVQIQNVLGISLDAYASAILIGN